MKLNNFPLVSIITNTYNSKLFLRRNIESIITQSYVNWEHIIVDCGSYDGTYEEALNLQHDRLKIFKIPFCSISDGRNFGINNSSGDIIAILDSDDFASADRLTSQVSALLNNKALVGIGSGMLRVDEGTSTGEKKFIYPKSSHEISFLLRAGFNPIPHSTFTFWKSAFYSAGGYSKLVEKGEDYELLLRMLNIGELSSIPKIHVTYSRRASSHTYTHQPELMWFYIFLALLLNSNFPPIKSDSLLVLKNNLLKLGHSEIKSYLAGIAVRNLAINFIFLEIKTINITLKMIFKISPAAFLHPYKFLEALIKGHNSIALKFSKI